MTRALKKLKEKSILDLKELSIISDDNINIFSIHNK
tara:strand:- start:1114 stop:1221 length:108 start_codon:yes stop_codon:yes gene_type:complete